MRARVVIGTAIVAGICAAGTAVAADDGDGPDRRGLRQAIQEAGLQDASAVRGEHVPGEGWVVERADETPDGATPYAPLD